MPAGLKFHSILIAALSLVTLLISACSRDNPLSIPAEYIEKPEAFCLENGPYTDLVFLESLTITNTVEGLPEGYPRAYENNVLNLSIPFAISNTEIMPVNISDFIPNPDETSEDEFVLVVTEKSLIPDLESLLTNDDDLEGITQYSPQVNSVTVTLGYPSEGSQTLETIDEETGFISADLEFGNNTVSTNVAANIKVPRTYIDCENPLTKTEVGSETFDKDEDGYKSITINQTFPVNIVRKDLESFEQSEVNTFVSVSENDQFGRVISLNDDFLVIGIPNEDSLAKGVVPLENYVSIEDAKNSVPPVELTATQNEDSENSGAVYIYQKSGLNTWSFHSFIKSSNNESGDLFGSAVALYGNTLAISAPGEDSFAAGIYNSFDAETENFKINNSASASGAVYLFEFDEALNKWSEQLYIKPDKNLISDGNYNKGFGRQLILDEKKLLISAPLEDSQSGGFDDSTLPDSGAVYMYKKVLNDWQYSQVLKANNPGTNDQFGSALSLNDDFLVVSSPFEDHDNDFITNKVLEPVSEKLAFSENNNREDSGSVYIFNYSIQTDTYALTTHIKSSNSDKLFVGAIGEDSRGVGLNRDMDNNDNSDSGAVYMFDFDQESNSWVETAYIKANDTQLAASFGKYIVATKDSLFITAPLFDSIADLNAGKVYFYQLIDSSPDQELLFQPIGQSAEARFGSQIASYGRNLAIGASGSIKVNSDAGITETFVGKLFTYE